MSNVSKISVGLAHELCITAAKAGFTPVELGSLAKNEDIMRQMRQVLLGYARVTAIYYLIDCDADPFVPSGWKVEEHQKGGWFKWDAAHVSLYLDKSQKKDQIEGNELRKALSDKSVLNVNVLDYLLGNRHLIPKEWKSKYIFFWGTIYRNPDHCLVVRCLYWNGSKWDWSDFFLDGRFRDEDPAALRAS